MADNSVFEEVHNTTAKCKFDQPTKIVIPFQTLLLQITRHLHFPDPKYQFVDITTNNAAVVIYTDCGLGVYTFVSGPCENIEKSCQKAAQNAVHDFMDRFNVWVEDISISKRREIERCGALYKLKRQEIRYLSKGVVGMPLMEKLGRGAPVGTVPVIVDFTEILRLIVRECDIGGSEIETVSHGRSKFTAWITITYPNASCGRKTFFSMCCEHLDDAKNSLAKTVIEYLIPIYNLEIIDANYNPKLTAYAAIISALEMESYIASKERLLEIEIMTATPKLLPVKHYSKRADLNLKIPTIISRPLMPKKNPVKSGSMLTSVKYKMKCGKRKQFKIPGELSTVFKRAKNM